jgi:aryl-alcohol dehydrogenase-like predicted oxidoreductase
MASRPALALDRYRLLGRSGLRVSPLALGTMTFGTEWGWGADEAESGRIFRAYADRGGNLLDTANFYTRGTSETFLGRLLGKDRDRFVLTTKYTMSARRGDPNAGGNHRKSLRQSVEGSLRRLGTDHLDLLWIHAWDFTVAAEEAMRALDDVVAQGKVLHVGISDAPAWTVAQANTVAALRGWSPFVALQVEYSLATRDAERDLLPMARAFGLAVLPWSPLAGGLLAGKYTEADLRRQQERLAAKTMPDPLASPERVVPLTAKRLEIAAAVTAVARAIGKTPAQVALRWLLDRPEVTSPIVGARRVAQLEENLGALDVTLDDEHATALDRVSRIPLGFPHDLLRGSFLRDIVSGGTTIDGLGP